MDISYDKTNESAYKYTESIHENIVDIIRPLKKYFGIKEFQHSKVFFDGRVFFLGSELKYIKFALQFILLHQGWLMWSETTPLQCAPTKNQLVPLLWPTTPNSPITYALQGHGLWHGITFCKIHKDHLELWGFIGDLESAGLLDLYIRNQDTLLKFIHFFKINAADIIKCAEEDEHNIGFIKCTKFLPRELPNQAETISTNAFLEELRKKSKHLHKVKPEFTYLTPREQECLEYLAQGDTAKEIARNLELSPYTVETHLKAIKCKTGFHSRSQLVKFFLNHFIPF